MNSQSSTPTGIGYLVVRASTARGALPLEGARVNIRGASPDTSGINLALVTDSAGLTKKVALPAPPRVLSESPSIIIPYSLYDVDVFKKGYGDLHFSRVSVFDSITSIQPAVMIPLADNEFTDNYAPGNGYSPSDI